jgi:glucose/arabinose dehydrogenase
MWSQYYQGQHFGPELFLIMLVTCSSRQENVVLTVNPQDLTRDNGKIYRLNADGSIPKDNPFVGVANAKEAILYLR